MRSFLLENTTPVRTIQWAKSSLPGLTRVNPQNPQGGMSPDYHVGLAYSCAHNLTPNTFLHLLSTKYFDYRHVTLLLALKKKKSKTNLPLCPLLGLERWLSRFWFPESTLGISQLSVNCSSKGSGVFGLQGHVHSSVHTYMKA